MAAGRRRGRAGRAVAALLITVTVVAAGLTFAWFHRPQVVLSPTCSATAGPYSTELDPDQARNAALIAGMAVRRDLPARAATIALATAAQESKLHNIAYGDRDSLGLFQQRASQGWGTRAQIMNPITSARTFYDHLLWIRGWQQMDITKAAQRVQHSGYPDAYAYHAEQARALAASFYGQYPAALACRLSPPEVVPNAARRVAADALADLALNPAHRTDSQLGYRFGRSASGRQHAWGLAHWAVACAETYGITAVHVDGRVWRRSDAETSWGRESAGSADTVVIELAA